MFSDNTERDVETQESKCQGSCLDLLPLCAAACCCEWVIGLSVEEYNSGLYKAEESSLSREKPYQLKKGIDGACIYLDDDSRCRIYENRPKVCRDYICQGEGLNSVFPWQTL